MVRGLASQSKPAWGPITATPTTLEVSRGTHVLEVVHVNDIDDGGHHPSPVLSRDKGRGYDPSQAGAASPTGLPSDTTIPDGPGSGMTGDS